MMTEIISRLVRDKYSFGRKLAPFYEGGFRCAFREELRERVKVIGRILEKVDVWCVGGDLLSALNLKRSSQSVLQGVAACSLVERSDHVRKKTRVCQVNCV